MLLSLHHMGVSVMSQLVIDVDLNVQQYSKDMEWIQDEVTPCITIHDLSMRDITANSSLMSKTKYFVSVVSFFFFKPNFGFNSNIS